VAWQVSLKLPYVQGLFRAPREANLARMSVDIGGLALDSGTRGD
jgi:hypothetical protein